MERLPSLTTNDADGHGANDRSESWPRQHCSEFSRQCLLLTDFVWCWQCGFHLYPGDSWLNYHRLPDHCFAGSRWLLTAACFLAIATHVTCSNGVVSCLLVLARVQLSSDTFTTDFRTLESGHCAESCLRSLITVATNYDCAYLQT